MSARFTESAAPSEVDDLHLARLRRWGFVTGLCLLALAMAGAVALGSCASTTGEAAGGSAGGAGQTGSIDSVRQRIDAALNLAGYLVKMSRAGVSPPMTFTAWTDPATGSTMVLVGSGPYRAAVWERDYYKGRVLYRQRTQVNYGLRTWSAYSGHSSAGTLLPALTELAGTAYTPAPMVREIFGKNIGEIVGHPVVDGRRTIELSASVHGARYAIWVDSRTYQVVRTATYLPSAMHVAPLMSDFYWVRASAAMTHLIDDPQIPAGFTNVSHLPFPGGLATNDRGTNSRS